MFDLDDQFLHIDPDTNYYDYSIRENHSFCIMDTIDDFLIYHENSFSDNQQITILSQNIRSLNFNLDNFLTLFHNGSYPDVLIFSETWHDIKYPIVIPGFKGYHVVREGRSGGVSIFVKSSISSCQISEYSLADQTIEICTVKIFNNSNNLFICGIYRPHSDNINNFCSTLENIIVNGILSRNNCILAGDFNINLLSEHVDVDRFIDMMRSHHYLQTITGVTHPGIFGASPSLIDHVWLNSLYTYSSGVIKTGITDHHTIFIQIPFITKKSISKNIQLKFRDCSEMYQIQFQNKVSNFNWENIKSNDVNEYTEKFVASLNKIYQESFPVKIKLVTEKYFKNPWYTSAVQKLSNVRTKLYNLLLENLITHREYSRYRNMITSRIRKSKKLYFERCFSRNISDVRKTWKLIRNICSGYQDRSMKEIHKDGVVYKENFDIAQIFNSFFTSIPISLSEIIPESTECPYSFVTRNILTPISVEPVTMIECSMIISNLKNTKQNIDHISIDIFKKYHAYFVQYLCEIVNLSFSSGVFPKCFKHAIVIPIFKKGDPANMSNYRPISLLPFLSKIFERCIFNRLVNYASVCSLLTPCQFGFTKGRSTRDAIIALTELVYDSWNDTDGSFSLNVFIDFQKCFDTINHHILVGKLEMYGVVGIFLDLIRDYLSERSQSVRVNNVMSNSLPIKIGVPQGSILGPLLFLFFYK